MKINGFNEFIKINEKTEFRSFNGKKELLDFLQTNGEDAEIKIDPVCSGGGGGEGTFVEFAASGRYVILATEDGNQSFNIVDVGYETY